MSRQNAFENSVALLFSPIKGILARQKQFKKPPNHLGNRNVNHPLPTRGKGSHAVPKDNKPQGESDGCGSNVYSVDV